jgi:uncharacterized damage-inducible protein DinB
MHCRITLLIWLLMPWRRSSAELIRFTEGLADDSVLSRVVRSVSLAGEPIADELGAGLQHVFNHSTFHRGQLVTMLRQAGIAGIPRTDLVAYTRL